MNQRRALTHHSSGPAREAAQAAQFVSAQGSAVMVGGLFQRLIVFESAAGCVTPGSAVEGTAEKLRFSVPSTLRAPAAPYLERWAP